MLFYIICYDVPDNKRRKQIADLLEGYGSRVQYSVFECVLRQKQFQNLQKKLKKNVIYKKITSDFILYLVTLFLK